MVGRWNYFFHGSAAELTQIVTINSKFADEIFIFESRFFLISMYFQRWRSLSIIVINCVCTEWEREKRSFLTEKSKFPLLISLKI